MQVGEETLSKNFAFVGMAVLDFMFEMTFLVSELGFHIWTCGHNTVFRAGCWLRLFKASGFDFLD